MMDNSPPISEGIKCFCCKKPLERLYNTPFPVPFNKDMIKGGFADLVRSGYGSLHDDTQFLVGFCDECIDDSLQDGRAYPISEEKFYPPLFGFNTSGNELEGYQYNLPLLEAGKKENVKQISLVAVEQWEYPPMSKAQKNWHLMIIDDSTKMARTSFVGELPTNGLAEIIIRGITKGYKVDLSRLEGGPKGDK